MKLIIDIDEEDFNLIRDNIKSYSLADVLFGAVKDGKPYEERPQGDLISREALLKAFANSEHIKETESGLDVMEMLAIKEIIDSAPTVPLPDFKAGYKQAIIDGKTNFSRPKGEWIGNAFNEHYCKRCGHPALWEEEPDDYYEVQSNFCPNCGAKMQCEE